MDGVKTYFGLGIVFFIFGIFLISFASSATFVNTVTTCSAEDSATKGTFGGACDDTSGASLQSNDGTLETHTYAKSSYAGVRVESVNSSESSCGRVDQVFICYEWWRTADFAAQDCDVSVDSNGGVSYSSANTTCPGTTANPGVTCTNVTSLETWTCENFFGLSGTRALAKSEISRVTAGSGSPIQTASWDVLYFNVTYTSNNIPTINNITLSSSIFGAGDTITIYANSTSNGVNDTDVDTLNLYCSNETTPNSTNTFCTAGNILDSSYTYDLTCSYDVGSVSQNVTTYCRVYDGVSYSSAVNATYEVDATSPTLSLISVAGDSSPTYFDTSNDAVTSVNISGEASMVCRWSNSDLSYSSMVNSCSIDSIYATCNFSDVSTQGINTRYISCADSLGNGNNATNNLDVEFVLDYTAPTTYDSSDSSIQVPSYLVTIFEQDNVDTDVTTLYCTDTIGTCTPSISADNGTQINFNPSTRGTNYLRYYSVDDAGNTQSTQNKTIRINQLPILTSAVDNATTIKGGSTVNVSTVSSDSDSGQLITLFVCDSNLATSAGCTDNQYCTATGTANLSCVFDSETDSAVHNWYAFIYDGSGEASVSNPLSGTYTTDSTSPTFTISSPTNTTYFQTSITAQISLNENANWSAYSLNEAANVTMNRISGTLWSSVISGLLDGSYNITFYSNDTYGNMNQSEYVYFTIDSTGNDTTAPTITIVSPLNNSYYTSASQLLNITTDESLSWAGYSINGSSIINLDNTSTTSWNTTISFSEGTNNITFYANDSSSNLNQANKSISVYIDLNNPVVNSFLCDSSINDSVNLTCNASVSDSMGLDIGILSYNFSGSFVNSSNISLSGTSDFINYTFLEGNYTPGSYAVQLYLFDDSGRVNETEISYLSVLDDTAPIINNISYSPNSTDALDNFVNVTINASITEDYLISNVSVYYINVSDSSWSSVAMTNTTTVDYNVTINFSNGNWTFYVNATDLQGNTNISSNYTLNVSDDLSQDISNSIPLVKSYTYAQRASANNLGNLILNNTGDSSLVFNVTISTDDSLNVSLFDINGTGNYSANFTVTSGTVANLTMYVNTTDLTSLLYPYNITITSSLASEALERNLNIQVASGPYLSVDITTAPSSVTAGEEDVSFVSTVTNLGTSTANGVDLNWTLPDGFSLSTGNLGRIFGSLGVGISGTNTITIDVSSSISSDSVIIYANATSTDANSSSDSAIVEVRDPITVSSTPASSSGGGGGGSSSSSSGGNVFSPVFKDVVELTRGEEELTFEIFVSAKYINTSLEGLTLEIEGYPKNYLEIKPSRIDKISYGENSSFKISLKAPIYSDFEEYNLSAFISGDVVYSSGTRGSYTDKRNILLYIQEISKEEVNSSFSLALSAINEMNLSSFNVAEVLKMLDEAKIKLEEHKNKEAYDLVNKIISTKEKAFETDELIRSILESLTDPKKSSLLVGNVIGFFEPSVDKQKSYEDFLTGKTVFGSEEVIRLMDLSIASFKRGDFDTSFERASSAQNLLIIERKGNPLFFFYMYWPMILLVGFFVFFGGFVGYRKFKKSNITRKIEELNNKEDNLYKLVRKTQEHYFGAKTSSEEFHRQMSSHQKELSKLRKNRLTLRNKRIRLLMPEQISQELKIESMQVESMIKKIQEDYYRDGKISKEEYEYNYKELNERLAEIEGERISFELSHNGKKKITEKVLEMQVKKQIRVERPLSRLKIFYYKLIGFFGRRR